MGPDGRLRHGHGARPAGGDDPTVGPKTTVEGGSRVGDPRSTLRWPAGASGRSGGDRRFRLRTSGRGRGSPEPRGAGSTNPSRSSSVCGAERRSASRDATTGSSRWPFAHRRCSVLGSRSGWSERGRPSARCAARFGTTGCSRTSGPRAAASRRRLPWTHSVPCAIGSTSAPATAGSTSSWKAPRPVTNPSAAAAQVRPLAEAGATWRIESDWSTWDASAMRRRIEAGLPAIDLVEEA
jgi:hypothetical protein